MAGKISIVCDKCKKRFSIQASMAGKRVRCICGNVVRVPEAEAKPVQKWYYAKGGDRHGPVGLDEIRGLRADGEIGDDDLVWRKGMATWTPASNVAEINAAAEEPSAEAGEAEEAADERQWYTAVDGEQTGPAGTEELKEMIRSGEVSAAALLWTDGMEAWAPIAEVEEFAGLVSAGPAAEEKAEEKAEEPAEEKAEPGAEAEAEAEAQAAPAAEEEAEVPAEEAPAAEPEAEEAEAEAAAPAEEAPEAAAPAAPPAPAGAAQPAGATQYRWTRVAARAWTVLGFVLAVLTLAVGVVMGVLLLKTNPVQGALAIVGGLIYGGVTLLLFASIAFVLRILADLGDRSASRGPAQ
jgi:hypothetical protein